MKRIPKLLTGALLGLFLILPFMSALAGVEGGYVDQKNDAISQITGSTGFWDNQQDNPYVQTFKPTATKITSIDLYLKNQKPGRRLNITLRRSSDGAVIKPATASVAFPMNQDGWVSVSYNDPFVTVEPGVEYQIHPTIIGDDQTRWPWTPNLYPNGEAGGMESADFLFMVNGTNGTTGLGNQAPNVVAENIPAAVVAPTVLAVPKGFWLETDGDAEKTFAWDKNTEASLTGYVMYVYDDETLVETIDVPGKETTSHQLAAADYQTLSADKQYVIKLAAKTAEAVSEKTEGLEITFRNIKPTINIVYDEAPLPWFANPYVMVGFGLLLLLLVGLLIYLERKHHGLAHLLKKEPKANVDVDSVKISKKTK